MDKESYRKLEHGGKTYHWFLTERYERTDREVALFNIRFTFTVWMPEHRGKALVIFFDADENDPVCRYLLQNGRAAKKTAPEKTVEMHAPSTTISLINYGRKMGWNPERNPRGLLIEDGFTALKECELL